MHKRTLTELVVVVALVLVGFISLQTSQQRDTHYSLDQGRITYNGGLLKHKFNGHGKLTLKNHDQYVGDFENGQFSGNGTFTSHEKWTYRGHFVAGVPDGPGTLTTDHHVYRGDFKKGALVRAH